jgi:hypothetical protein
MPNRCTEKILVFVDVLRLFQTLPLLKPLTNHTMKKHPLFILLVFLASFACSDKEDEEPNTADPLVGNWHLVALEQNGQTVEITDQPCIKDSRLNVDPSTMTLTLSAPREQGGTDCQTESSSINWVNDNGTYYMVEDGDRQPAIFSLEPNNQLTVDITLDGNPLSLIFTK